MNAAIALGALGAALQVFGGLLETVDRVEVGEPGFGIRTTVIGGAYLLIALTPVAMHRTGSLSGGRYARPALTVVIAGWLLSAVAQVVLRTDVDLAELVLFPVATVAIGAGMTVAAVSALRAGQWHRWRLVPLLCGVYPFVVLFPTFAATGEPNFLVFTGWGLCWLLLSVALWQALRAREAQPVAWA